MFASLAMVSPSTILIITAILLAIIAVACCFVYRTTPTQSAHHARERAMRPRVEAKPVDPWSAVPYEPEAFNRVLLPAEIKPPARKPWQPNPTVSAEEQARIEARVQDQQSKFLKRAIAREVQLSDTEFSRLFPAA